MFERNRDEGRCGLQLLNKSPVVSKKTDSLRVVKLLLDTWDPTLLSQMCCPCPQLLATVLLSKTLGEFVLLTAEECPIWVSLSVFPKLSDTAPNWKFSLYPPPDLL